MIRLNHRQMLTEVADPESPLIVEGPNGLFAGSECMVPNQVKFNETDSLLTQAGWVTWPGSGTWRVMPDALVETLFADSFNVSASLALGRTNYGMAKTLPAGQAEAYGPSIGAVIRTPIHSTLAEEYDVTQRAPRTESETGPAFFGAYTSFEEVSFSGDSEDDDSTSEFFRFSLIGSPTLRQSDFTYNRDEDLWGMRVGIGASLYWDTNRLGEDEGPTRGQASALSDSGTANFTLPMLGGTYKGRVTGAGFGGEPDNVMGFIISVEVAAFRDLY